MNPRVTIAATADPLTLDEAKAHLRVSGGQEDADVLRRLRAAVKHCEDLVHRAFVSRTYEYLLDGFPADGVIRLPRAPLQSVEEVTYVDSDGVEQTLDEDLYQVVTSAEPGEVVLYDGCSWPTTKVQREAVTVTYVAGYGGPEAVPEDFKAAILLSLGDLYEQREESLTGTIHTPTGAVLALLGSPVYLEM